MAKYQKKKKKIKPIKAPKVNSNIKNLLPFLRKHCNEATFLEDFWFTNNNNVRIVDSKNRINYLPGHEFSANLVCKTFSSKSSEDENGWIQLKAFESVINKQSSCATAFIGSHSYAMEWLSQPWHWPTHQSSSFFDCDYLLIATASRDDCFTDYEKPNYIKSKSITSKSGLLQLWKYDNKNNHLELVCCFAHDFGSVWTMEACKGGTSYNKEKNRLSLVAIGFNDGYVRLFSIPFPESLPQSKYTPPMYMIPPVVVLDPPYREHILCKSMSWSWTDKQGWLAVGYGNGFASLYNLLTKSSLLIKANEESKIVNIKSHRTWFAHGAMISAILIMPFPGSNLIVTGSFDRMIKLWNLKETNMPPICIQHRSIVHSLAVTLNLPIGFFTALEDCFLAPNQAILAFKQIIAEGERNLMDPKYLYSLPMTTSNVYSISFSLFINSLLAGDNAGNVFLHNNFVCKHDRQRNRKLTDVLPSFITHLSKHTSGEEKSDSQASNADTSKHNNGDDDGYLISKIKSRERSYEAITSKYGVIFQDFIPDLDDPRKINIFNKFKDNPKLKKCRLTDYPLTAINKCVWSPNKKSSHSFACLVHAGFIRVTRLPTSFTYQSKNKNKKYHDDNDKDDEDEHNNKYDEETEIETDGDEDEET